jgi:hypothetical protein
MQMLDVRTIIDQAQPLISQHLIAGERHRRQCYLERRQWQLQQFNIGYHPDWSREELIAALHKKLKSLRKMARQTPWAAGLIVQPMVRTAFLAEVESAGSKAA